MLENIIGNPEEEKFQTINLENAAFKKRVGALSGGISLLRAVGFSKDFVQDKLVLDKAKLDLEKLKTAVQSIDKALAEEAPSS